MSFPNKHKYSIRQFLLGTNLLADGRVFAGVLLFLLLANVGLLYALKEPVSVLLWSKFRITLVGYVYADTPEVQLMIGQHYFGFERYHLPRAEFWFRRAVSAGEEFAPAHWWMARLYFVQGKLFSAERHATRAVELDPEEPRVYYLRGLINGYNNNLSPAIADFKHYVEIFPSMWAGYNDLAWLYFKKGDYEAARDIARSGLEKTSYPYGDNPWLLNSYGVAEMNLGNAEKAISALKRADIAAREMTPSRWGAAYPGNDPKDYAKGLSAFRLSIQQNLAILEEGEKSMETSIIPL
jgi:tetratricopeptide (TPR) repeat protein